MPEVPLEKDDIESWTLFTDGASSPKGSGAGLVLIGPNGIKYTYALRLTFPSTNNEVKYEALLVRPRIARQMNISNIEVKVDSSLWRIRSMKITKPIKTARTTTPSKGRRQVRNRSNRYFTKLIEAKPLVKITGNEVHRTSIKQSNEETPFSFTYDREVVIPVEISIPTFPTLMIREGYNEEEMRLNPDLLQERRETTAIREARYKTKMEQYYNKKVRPTGFRPGEFVFRRNEAIGLRTKASWDQNGKDPTRSWNHTKMAPTS
nr:reverse transcriptase domain-containing protein [Tanacetum cinerariifolium]